MTTKEYSMVALFQQFINDSYKGKRLKADGGKIKPQTISNYNYALKYLHEYESSNKIVLRIKVIRGENKRAFEIERNYWKKFYLHFTGFLYTQKNCYDNYVGTIIKTIRIFFNYLNSEKGINTGEFYKSFYVCKEDVPIITLMPGQLQFLINNKAFEESLTNYQQRAKAIFVFGCTVALRISDLFNIKFNDIEKVGDRYYLAVKTIKTGISVRIKLPRYAIDIIEQFKKVSGKRETIFPFIQPARFNYQLKAIAATAGWTNEK